MPRGSPQRRASRVRRPRPRLCPCRDPRVCTPLTARTQSKIDAGKLLRMPGAISRSNMSDELHRGCRGAAPGAKFFALPAIRTPVGPAAAARSFLSVQGQFSGGVWLARQSANFAEEPLEGPDLVAQCPPPFRGDLYPGAWAAIARCLALGNEPRLFQRLEVPAKVAVRNTERRLQVPDVCFSETAQRCKDAEPYSLMHIVVDVMDRVRGHRPILADATMSTAAYAAS